MLLKIFDSNGVAHPLQDIQDGRIEHVEDGCDKLIFSIDVRHELYPLIAEESVIHYNKNSWLVKKIQDDLIECHLDFDFIKQSILKDYSYQNQRLSTVLQAMLPAGWTIVGADANTYFRGKTYVLCTPFEVIYDCIEKYDVRFVWSILEKKLVVKTPSLITSSGVYLSDQLNLTSLAFQGSTAGFITRLYPYGAEGLSVAEINDGKEYIDNNSYSDKIVCAYWVDERYTDKMSLLEAAHEKLASLCVPERSYECKVRDIAKQSSKYSDLSINIHDKITLLVSERKIKVLYSVISYTEFPDDPESNKVTLSCVPDTIQSYTQALVQARVNEAIVVADKALQKIDVVDGKVDTLDDRVATAEAKALEIEGKADDAANRAEVAIVGVVSAELRVSEVIKGFSASKSRYFAGTKSPTYGRSYANAVEIMEEGMVYVPTITHTEEFNLNPSFSFDKGFLYSWLSNAWVKGAAVFFGAELPTANVDGSLWFCEQNVTAAGITYEKNSLYKFSLVSEGNGTWIVVASLSDNYVYKNITSLREGIVSITAVLNENSADINLLAAWQTEATTTIAQISQKADDNQASISTLIAFMGNAEGGAIKAIADLEYTTNAHEASISSLVAWMGNTESGAIKSIADVTQKATANESSIESITEWIGDAGGGAIKAIADVTQKSNANEASISSLTEWQSGGKNKFDISKVVDNEYVTNHQTYLSVTTPIDSSGISAGTANKLKDYAPDLVVGETYTISFITTSTKKNIYLLESDIAWSVGESRIITQLMLDSAVYFYVDEAGGTATISEIQIEPGSSVTGYQAYVEGVQRSLTNVIQKADANGASIGLLVDSNGVKGSILVEAINGQSTIKIDAERLNLTGYATFTGLSGGTTTIDGACIKTGIIDAERLNVDQINALGIEAGSLIIYPENHELGELFYAKGTTLKLASFNVVRGINSYIAYGKTAFNDISNGIYLGTDGISLGNNSFKVTSAGALFASDVNISGTGTIKSNNYISLIIEGANPNQEEQWNATHIYHVSDEEYAEQIGYYRFEVSDWVQYEEFPDVVQYSVQGTEISLEDGYFRSKNFVIDGSGNAYFKGNIEADSGKIGNFTITENGFLEILTTDYVLKSAMSFSNLFENNWYHSEVYAAGIMIESLLDGIYSGTSLNGRKLSLGSTDSGSGNPSVDLFGEGSGWLNVKCPYTSYSTSIKTFFKITDSSAKEIIRINYNYTSNQTEIWSNGYNLADKIASIEARLTDLE